MFDVERREAQGWKVKRRRDAERRDARGREADLKYDAGWRILEGVTPEAERPT
jgi:hypothetical protein